MKRKTWIFLFIIAFVATLFSQGYRMGDFRDRLTPEYAPFVLNNVCYIGGGGFFRTIDVSNPSRPRQIGICPNDGHCVPRIDMYRNSITKGNIKSTFTHAYIADYYVHIDKLDAAKSSHSVRIMDIPSDTRPKIVYGSGYQSTFDISIERGNLFLLYGNSFRAYRLKNLEMPISQGVFQPLNSLSGRVHDTGRTTMPRMGILGDRVFIAGAEGLRILDISNLWKIKSVHLCQSQKPLRDVFVFEIYDNIFVYTIEDNKFSTYTFNYSTNKLSPLGSCELPNSSSRIFASGSYVYVLNNRGIYVIDVSIPDKPSIAGKYKMSTAPMNIFVHGTYAYVTSIDGLHIIDIFDEGRLMDVGKFEF